MPPGDVIKRDNVVVGALPLPTGGELVFLRRDEKTDAELILAAKVFETDRSAFHLATRIHSLDAFVHTGQGTVERIGLKEVYLDPYSKEDAVEKTVEEAARGRLAGSEAALDEVWVAESRFPFATVRLAGDYNMRVALRTLEQLCGADARAPAV
ncbi:MAG TPA: hypothetical protein VFH51_02850, partial [Myxococcota bacterium]|nr:hypothetical protein [Myxococcota bacterium]